MTESTGRLDPSGELARPFRIDERFDDDGTLRVVLVGELDLAVADQVKDRLSELSRARHPVRLDLTALEFIDSMGLRELILGLGQARSDGWSLEIDPRVTEPVRRVIDLCGVRDFFWPG